MPARGDAGRNPAGGDGHRASFRGGPGRHLRSRPLPGGPCRRDDAGRRRGDNRAFVPRGRGRCDGDPSVRHRPRRLPGGRPASRGRHPLPWGPRHLAARPRALRPPDPRSGDRIRPPGRQGRRLPCRRSPRPQQGMLSSRHADPPPRRDAQTDPRCAAGGSGTRVPGRRHGGRRSRSGDPLRRRGRALRDHHRPGGAARHGRAPVLRRRRDLQDRGGSRGRGHGVCVRRTASLPADDPEDRAGSREGPRFQPPDRPAEHLLRRGGRGTQQGRGRRLLSCGHEDKDPRRGTSDRVVVGGDGGRRRRRGWTARCHGRPLANRTVGRSHRDFNRCGTAARHARPSHGDPRRNVPERRGAFPWRPCLDPARWGDGPRHGPGGRSGFRGSPGLPPDRGRAAHLRRRRLRGAQQGRRGGRVTVLRRLQGIGRFLDGQ